MHKVSQVRKVSLFVNKVDYRKFKTNSQGKRVRMNWLDFYCDGCGHYASSSYDRKIKSSGHHTHKELLSMPRFAGNFVEMSSGEDIALTRPGIWFGSIAELKGRTPRIFKEQRAAAVRREAAYERQIESAEQTSNDISKLRVEGYYRWMRLMQRDNYCGEQVEGTTWQDKIFRHPEVEYMEPGWCDTGWSVAGGYYDSYQERAREVSNWEYVQEKLLGGYPGFFEMCGSKLMIWLPCLMESNWLRRKGEYAADYLIEEMETFGPNGNEAPMWFQALDASWHLHDDVEEGNSLDDQREYELIYEAEEESFKTGTNRSIMKDLLKLHPQFGKFNEEYLAQEDMSEKSLTDIEWTLWEALEMPGYDDPESEDYKTLLSLYSRCCSYHGEGYFDDRSIEDSIKDMYYGEKWPTERTIFEMYEEWKKDRENNVATMTRTEMITAGQKEMGLNV